MKPLHVVAAMLLCTPAMSAETYFVTEVVKGDTLIALSQTGEHKRIRVYGIDAPVTNCRKLSQPLAEESRAFLENATRDTPITVRPIATKNGTVWGVVYIDKTDIAVRILEQGYAEAYHEFLLPPYRDHYISLEAVAKTKRKGIWGLNEYERPSSFRKRNGC